MFVIYIVLLIFVLIIFKWWKTRTSLKRQCDNDFVDYPIIRHAHMFFGSSGDWMDMFKKFAHHAYSNKSGVSSIWFGPFPLTIVSDPKHAVAVLKASHSKGHFEKLMQRLLGNGLAFAPVHTWLNRRKILLPSFSSKHLRQFVHIFEVQSERVVSKLQSQVGKGNFSIWLYIALYTLDSICETGFGIDLNIQNQSRHPLSDRFIKYMQNILVMAGKPWLRYNFIYNMLPISREQNRLKKAMTGFIDNVMYKKEAMISEKLKNTKTELSGEDSRATTESILESMIKSSEGSGKKYTHEELREEILTLTLAGFDTSAAGVCFVITLLSRHPDIQERVYQEILEVLGENKPFEMEDLHKLKYMDAVIKETLRLYPPGPVILRHFKQQTELPTGLVMAKKETAIINIWGIHHNPHYWGPDVEEFNPDRFISRPQPVAGSYIPFSTGLRNCIGLRYASLSMKTVIASVLRNFRVKPATSFTYGKDNPLRVTSDILLRHLNNFEIQIERRC